MSTLLFVPGITLPIVCGWMFLSILEGKTPVLFRYERWVLGFAIGWVLTMYTTFLVHITGLIPLSFTGFLIVQLALTLLLAVFWKRLKRTEIQEAQEPDETIRQWFARKPPWFKAAVSTLALWTILKILFAGVTFLMLTPPYFDDALDNWNFRGKQFFVEKQLVLVMPDAAGNLVKGGVHSYPPTVSMGKTWLASIRGEWHEGLINSLHLLWYLAAIVLIFFALRRFVGIGWSLAGVYLLSSLPLYLIQGTNPYADVFLSVHLFVPVMALMFAAMHSDPMKRMTWFKLSAATMALLPFTKNEALIIHFPVLLLLLAGVLWFGIRARRITMRQSIIVLLWHGLCTAAVAGPWLLYKWANSLTFGNAKGIGGLQLEYHPGVLRSIGINTFLEGNWILLFPLAIILLVLRRRDAFGSALVVPTAFFLIVILGQIPLYLFTYLFTEALWQTGYARGLIQLMPVIVFVTTVLFSKAMKENG